MLIKNASERMKYVCDRDDNFKMKKYYKGFTEN